MTINQKDTHFKTGLLISAIRFELVHDLKLAKLAVVDGFSVVTMTVAKTEHGGSILVILYEPALKNKGGQY